MGKDLAVSNGRSGLAKGASNAGRGADISAAVYEEKALAFGDDMPTQFRRTAPKTASNAPKGAAASSEPSSALVLRPSGKQVAVRTAEPGTVQTPREQPVASGVRSVPKLRRSGDRVVARRIGWRAWPSTIEITTAEREHTQIAQGKYKPAGDWMIEHREVYRVTQPPVKRVGQVPLDLATASSDTQPPADASGAPPEFPEGEAALAYLPAAVRSSVRNAVTDPKFFDGDLIQWSQGDTVDRLELSLLRADADTAVVVLATKKPSADSWTVTQVTYQLPGPEVEHA